MQSYTNVAKEEAGTSFWLSQETSKTIKSMHFANDILQKSKIHGYRFQARKNNSK